MVNILHMQRHTKLSLMKMNENTKQINTAICSKSLQVKRLYSTDKTHWEIKII